MQTNDRSLESGTLIGITIVPAQVLPSVTRTEDVDLSETEATPVTTPKGAEKKKKSGKNGKKSNKSGKKVSSPKKGGRKRTRTLKKVISVKYKCVYIINNQNNECPNEYSEFYSFLEQCLGFSYDDWMKHFDSILKKIKKEKKKSGDDLASVSIAKLLFARDEDNISKSWVKFLITKLEGLYSKDPRSPSSGKSPRGTKSPKSSNSPTALANASHALSLAIANKPFIMQFRVYFLC